MSRPDTALTWAAAGQAQFERAVAECGDLRGPSRLPDWTRGHVVSHVTRNAEGLVRLELQIPGRAPVVFGPETTAPVPVSGPVQELAGWLTGRFRGDRLIAPDGLPELPGWL